MRAYTRILRSLPRGSLQWHIIDTTFSPNFRRKSNRMVLSFTTQYQDLSWNIWKIHQSLLLKHWTRDIYDWFMQHPSMKWRIIFFLPTKPGEYGQYIPMTHTKKTTRENFCPKYQSRNEFPPTSVMCQHI